MVGILDTLDQKMTIGFKHAGDSIYMLGVSHNDIGSSEYLHHILGVSHSPAPHMELDEEFALQQTVARLNQEKIIKSAHDISEGGLFACLLESAMVNGLGFDVHVQKDIRRDAALFGEGQSRVIVTVNHDLDRLFEAELKGHPFFKLGHVSSQKEITIDGENWGYVADWKEAYDTAIEKMLA
jgi:phosphoribosylformylglycinamidine synthase